LAAIIDVLETHLDRQSGISELIEVRREIIDE
jgi:hypothetical protein